MLRLFFYLIIGLMIFLFASQNLEIVPVYLFAGRPLEMPLIAVVGFSFFAGFVSAILGVIRRAFKGGGRKTKSSLANSRRRS